jgi:hypothetical protein
MKKLIFGALLLAACGTNSHNGTYVNQFNNAYGIGTDTFVVSDGFITRSSGYHLIRDGHLLPNKEYSTKKWYRNSPEMPVMEFRDGQLILGRNTVYHQIK